jgi:hypothetical protein
MVMRQMGSTSGEEQLPILSPTLCHQTLPAAGPRVTSHRRQQMGLVPSARLWLGRSIYCNDRLVFIDVVQRLVTVFGHVY